MPINVSGLCRIAVVVTIIVAVIAVFTGIVIKKLVHMGVFLVR